MKLRFVFCAACGKHVRCLGKPGTVPIEHASQASALLMMEIALARREIAQEEVAAYTARFLNSGLAETDGEADPSLVQQIAAWNASARATNDCDRFARTDFHDYVRLLAA